MEQTREPKASAQASSPIHKAAANEMRLYGYKLTVARLFCLFVFLFSAGLFVAALLVEYRTLLHPSQNVQRDLSHIGISLTLYAFCSITSEMVTVAGSCVVAAIIFWRKSQHPMALYVVLLIITFVIFQASAPQSLAQQYPFWQLPITLFNALGNVLFNLFFLLFPTGRFIPRWTRWLALWFIIYSVLWHLPPSLLLMPLNWPVLLLILSEIGGAALCLFAQIYRYRRVSDPVQRQQIKWAAFGLIVVGVTNLLNDLLHSLFPSFLQPDAVFSLLSSSLLNVLGLLIPLSFGIAILRYRLWDIDLIINRTLVYGTLTASIIGLYVLLVTALGAALRAEGNLLISLFATGLVAVLFQPLRELLQRSVNRLLYGQRDEPYSVITRLSQRLKETLEQEAVLSTIVETVAQVLKLPYAAILWKQEDTFELAASYGSPAGDLITLPLVYQAETIGQLELAPRSPGETFTPADMHLLDELARQAGLAAHAVRLATDLQKARERLVLAREEERRRLRRDLHDGVGPTLASLSQRIDTARHLVPHDPDAAIALLDNLKVQVKSTIVDIRRVVYALRPPVLDELGLVSAISEYVMQLQETNGLHISLELPAAVPELSAAVEVAAYRITLEALTNIERHARAQHCILRIKLLDGRYLSLSISDDGHGLPEDYHAGVGITSMRERAAELGGEFTLTTTQGQGTCIQVRLPLKS